MRAITIYRAKNLSQAAHRQEAIPNAMVLPPALITKWQNLEPLISKKKIEYFNGDDGNVWMVSDSLFLYKVSEENPVREKVRIVGILRENEDSKELVFDSEIFEDTDEHRNYARKNNLLLLV